MKSPQVELYNMVQLFFDRANSTQVRYFDVKMHRLIAICVLRRLKKTLLARRVAERGNALKASDTFHSNRTQYFCLSSFLIFPVASRG